jgi:hypothetical protein
VKWATRSANELQPKLGRELVKPKGFFTPDVS